MNIWKNQDLQNTLATLRAEHDALHQRFEAYKADAELRHRRDLRQVVEAMLRQRTLPPRPRPLDADRGPIDLKPSPDHPDLETCLARLQKLAPAAYAHWQPLLQVNADTYDGFPVHSCSVDGHRMADLFRCFLTPYLSGAVLDIGCGPQPVPSYLAKYPAELLAGVDPLPPASSHPFTFVQTVAEFLPWPAETFDVVVVGTSLDHVLLVDRALDEMHRVLRPDGHLLIWVSFVPGAEPYDPMRPDIKPVDEYHLFHFDRPWFEQALQRRFIQREVITFFGDDSSCFYACQPVVNVDA